MIDKISCGCGNKFNVFEKSHQWRLISCIKCRRRWWITCSGRRLREVKMIKLFIDDIRREPEGWHRARTVTEAIRILATMSVEEVSLDHDIACYDHIHKHEHPSEETFFTVARYIALMPKEIRPKVRIHTGNFPKGREMADFLGIPYNNYVYDPKDYE